RREIREHAAEPALRHMEGVRSLRLALDDRAKLPLRTDEEDPFAARDHVANQALCQLDLTSRLLQVDDVDAVPLREDELPHLRVPTAGLVAEMYAGLQEFLDLGCSRHVPSCSALGSSTTAFIRPAYHNVAPAGT